MLMLVSVAFAAVTNTDVNNAVSTFAGKIGIGVAQPREALDVNGSIVIGESVNNTPGTIRYQNDKFEGRRTTGWGSLGGGATLINLTTVTTYTGNLTNGSLVGYQAGNAICSDEFSGSHMCRTDDILNVIANEGISYFSGYSTAWIVEGPPGYLANANSCLGQTSETATDLGAFWAFDSNGGGKGWLVNCATQKALACCS